jgi:hypothetical protein
MSTGMANVEDIDLSFTFNHDINAQINGSLQHSSSTSQDDSLSTIDQGGWVGHVFAVGEITGSTTKNFEIQVSEVDGQPFTLGGDDGKLVVMRNRDHIKQYISGYLGLGLSEHCSSDGAVVWSDNYPCVKVIDRFEDLIEVSNSGLNSHITRLIKGADHSGSGDIIPAGTYQADLQMITTGFASDRDDQASEADGGQKNEVS